MIYVLDSFVATNSHSQILTKIIKDHTSEIIELVELPSLTSSVQLSKVISNLIHKIKPNDVVLAAWGVRGDHHIDELFSALAQNCFVIVAAGNSNEPIENYSPTRADNVFCIGALNKNGVKASHSNYSEFKDLTWICGTNYYVDGVPHSGTSISAAIYAGMLAESIRINNTDYLFTLIDNYHKRVYAEVNHKIL